MFTGGAISKTTRKDSSAWSPTSAKDLQIVCLHASFYFPTLGFSRHPLSSQILLCLLALLRENSVTTKVSFLGFERLFHGREKINPQRYLQQNQNCNGELLRLGRLLWKCCVGRMGMFKWFGTQQNKVIIVFPLCIAQKLCHFMHHSQLSLLIPQHLNYPERQQSKYHFGELKTWKLVSGCYCFHFCYDTMHSFQIVSLTLKKVK